MKIFFTLLLSATFCSAFGSPPPGPQSLFVPEYADGIIFLPQKVADSVLANVYVSTSGTGGPSHIVFTSTTHARGKKSAQDSDHIVCTKSEPSGRTLVHRHGDCL